MKTGGVIHLNLVYLHGIICLDFVLVNCKVLHVLISVFAMLYAIAV